MSNSKHHHVATLLAAHLLIAALLMGFASISRADTIYNFRNYPVDQVDLVGRSTDATLAGTIITDGNIGTLTSADVKGGTIFLTTVSGTFVADITGVSETGSGVGLTASTTALTIGDGSKLIVITGSLLNPPDTGDNGTNPWTIAISYQNNAGTGLNSFYQASVSGDDIGNYEGFAGTYGGLGGHISDNDPWIIATVPEPASFTLLVSALMGLAGAVYLRRRRAAV